MGRGGEEGGGSRTSEGARWRGEEEEGGGGSKGDETVGVCNCNGFNALLMADGTRDWGNGLHQMSLLAGERRRCRRKREETRETVYSRRHSRGVEKGHVDILLSLLTILSSPLPFLRATDVGIKRYIPCTSLLSRPLALSPISLSFSLSLLLLSSNHL